MSHKLTDITLYYYGDKQLAIKFTMMHNVVEGLYVHFLDGYKPPKTSRMSVVLGDHDDPGTYFGSILGPTASFDKDHFWRLERDGQNKMILDTIHRIALLCAKNFQWDTAPFEIAYQQVLDTNFVYCIDSKLKMSRDRLHKACVRVEMNERNAIISAVFFDKIGHLVKKVELLTAMQFPYIFEELTRNYKWFNNREFGVFHWDDELVLKASLDRPDPSTVITPIDRTRDELEGTLRRVTYHELETTEDRVKWANQ